MFESVYDYPYLSSSANQIFDVTFGYSTGTFANRNVQNSKKINIYNQMAQVLMGYNVTGNIQHFDSDGTLPVNADDTTGKMNHCFFVNFSRLLTKDEIKKNSFRLQLYTSASRNLDQNTGSGAGRGQLLTFGDYLSATQFRSSPAGDYGLLFTGSTVTAEETGKSVGLIFYQAGIAVLTSSIFTGSFNSPGGSTVGPLQANGNASDVAQETVHAGGTTTAGLAAGDDGAGTGLNRWGVNGAQTGSSIEELSNAFRHTIHDIDFNNTIELNSSIYFCRVNHNEFNYSSNPTYVAGSKLVVKNNVNDLPVSYITSVGLYSPDNELLAVAKLSEPLRKDPNTELTLRVRLDY